MTKQMISPIVGWESAAKILEQWLVLIDIILGPPELHPDSVKLSIIMEAAEEVSEFLRAQAYHQPDMPAPLIHLVQT